MKCIIVNDDTSMRKTIEKLIAQTDDMEFVSAFNTTFEAHVFLKSIKIDIVFFDIQMYDVNNLEFIQNIPENTFVIYIPEFSPFANTSCKTDIQHLSEPVISKRFKKGVDEARVFLELIQEEKSDISDDYFVI
jgi:two-component SAPR family response regulator